ncbi:unnamed protein product, partial [Musa acuminata subsp. burmannicoides]
MALKAEMLLTRPPIATRQCSTPTTQPGLNKEKQVVTESIQPANQGTNIRGATKQAKHISTTTNNPYARPLVGKCFKCGESGHHSNDCRAHKTVNLTDHKDDFEEEGDAQNDTINDIDNAEIVEEEGEHVACVVKRLLLTQGKKIHLSIRKSFILNVMLKTKYALIIDGGSCDNIISKSLVRHLKLQTEAHLTPYKLGWIKEGPTVTVTKICKTLLIGKSYKEEVICEVVDMDACHVLLGRLWQYDVNATHFGRKNVYVFWWNGKKIAILPTNRKGDESNTSKVEGKSFLSNSNSVQEFIVSSKETR